MRRAERPFLELPRILLLGFSLLFGCQILFHHYAVEHSQSAYAALSKPLSAKQYNGIAMGSEYLLGYLLAIRLQLHDNQMGRHFRYSLIDYHLLVDWLDQISEMNPRSEYPLLLASRVYSQTRDKDRLRLILEFIDRRFEDDPQKHWRRLAEASTIAKHNLGDLELALQMAEKLALQPDSVIMPQWARDFRFLLLADLSEYELAITIIEALMQTDAVTDPDEKRFLEEKLSDFQQKLLESQQIETILD